MGIAVRKHPSRCPLKAGFLMYRRARLCFVNGLRYGARACTDSRQQPHNPPQGLPGRLVHCRIRTHQLANHLPSSNVEVTDGWWSHSQGDRTQGTETDPPGPRLLARSYSHGLREQKYRDGLVSRLEFPITAKAIHLLQRPLLAASCRNKMLPLSPGERKWIEGFPASLNLS